MKYPACYGWLHDKADGLCQACLVGDRCKTATAKPRERAPKEKDVIVPDVDKRLLVLMLCQKFGIRTVYVDKQKHEQEITEENYTGYYNLDFLLTNKESLAKLYAVALKDD